MRVLHPRLGEHGCQCRMRTEPREARERRVSRRQRRGTRLVYHIKDAPSIKQKFGVWWDPSETEVEWDNERIPKNWHGGPDMRWLQREDFFMSDAEPREPSCHHYCEVSVGDLCHRCMERVRGKWSGISCPCGHTWFCA